MVEKSILTFEQNNNNNVDFDPRNANKHNLNFNNLIIYYFNNFIIIPFLTIVILRF